jgi:molybdopterin synthase sulfur carrier subunit
MADESPKRSEEEGRGTTKQEETKIDCGLVVLQFWTAICRTLWFMMKTTILAFGVAKEMFGAPAVVVEWGQASTVGNLKILLEEKYPALSGLGSYLIAVNNEYAEDGLLIEEGDEVAVIPPVSGG